MPSRTIGRHEVLDGYARYLQRLVALGHIRHRTWLCNHRIARRFLARYGTVPLDQITPEHVESYLIGLQISPRAMQTELMRLRAFFRWLVDDQCLLRVNPCLKVHRPKWRPNVRECPTLQEFYALCRQCRTVEEAALIEGFYATGLRLRELQTLRGRQIDFARRRITLVGKGGHLETAYFLPVDGRYSVIDLWRALVGAPDAYLFANPSPRHRGGARSVQWILDTLRRLGEQAGLPYRLTAHLLRHGCAWA